MRDIRTDLQERLAAAEAERARISTTVQELDAEILTLARLIEIEDQRRGANGHAKKKPAAALEDFLVSLARQRAITKEGMLTAARAEGYDVNGRHVHAHLMKLLRDGTLAVSREGIVAR